MRNPAVMQQAQQLVPEAAVATGSNNTAAQDVRAEPCSNRTLPPTLPPSIPRSVLARAWALYDEVLHYGYFARVQDEDKMIEEALRRSMEEMNYGTGSRTSDASGGGSA